MNAMPAVIGFLVFAGGVTMSYLYPGDSPHFTQGAPALVGGQGNVQNPPSVPTPTQPTKPPATPKKPLELLTGVTFANDPGTTYVLARDLASRLGVPLELSADGKTLTVGDQPFEEFRRLFTGDVLIPIRAISKFYGTLVEDPTTHSLTISVPQGQFEVKVGEKRIDVDKATQELTAYQGEVIVLKTNVSTGRPGHGTPSGDFVTGPDKELIHYSHKYDDAPMPFAIQVHGDVFLHGYTSVPHYPASHGCVRIPLNHKNPAKYLYGWAERGIPTKIHGTFSWEDYAKKRHHRKRRR